MVREASKRRDESRRFRCLVSAATALTLLTPAAARAQSVAARLGIIQADERHAANARDLQTIRTGARSSDGETARLAVRALGRLGRTAVVPDLIAALRHADAAVRAEAAQAIAEGTRRIVATALPRSAPFDLAPTQTALEARLNVDDDPNVRAAVAEAIARLPFRNRGDADRASATLVGFAAASATSVTDRVGAAKALNAYIRLQAPLGPIAPTVMTALNTLAQRPPGPAATRDARVRRLAVDALVVSGAADPALIAAAADDPDAQVRRLAVAAAGATTAIALDTVLHATSDTAPMVRIEALRALARRDPDAVCGSALRAAADTDMGVALVALDLLGNCGRSSVAVAYLERTVADQGDLRAPRGWHRHAHALLALAIAAPDRVLSPLAFYAAAPTWQLRHYAARAAAQAVARPLLESLAADTDDRVANVALAALQRPPRPVIIATPEPVTPLDIDELRRLAAPRARITVRDVGRFEIALFTAEAPGTVVRFVRLAQTGYYNGAVFDRVVANSVAEIGHHAAPEARRPVNEVGLWPHVRGAVAMSTPDGSDSRFFVNLVDNPALDHEHAVFGQLLNGAEIIDQLLEGDVIESIEILP